MRKLHNRPLVILIIAMLFANCAKIKVATSGNYYVEDGVIVFKGKTTDELLNIIEKRYNVSVVYNTTRKNKCLFAGKIAPDTEIETVIEIMEFMCSDLQLRYDTIKKILVVSRQNRVDTSAYYPCIN